MRRYWLLWFVATFPIGFLIPEAVALIRGRPQDTLSAAIWSLEKFKAGQPVWQWNAFHFLFGGVLLTLFAWLTGHFLLGWWR